MEICPGPLPEQRLAKVRLLLPQRDTVSSLLRGGCYPLSRTYYPCTLHQRSRGPIPLDTNGVTNPCGLVASDTIEKAKLSAVGRHSPLLLFNPTPTDRFGERLV